MIPVNKEHIPDRPSWECRVCAAPWPCMAAREALLIEFAKFPSVLRIYLFGQLTDAGADIPGIEPAELYRRFLGWSR